MIGRIVLIFLAIGLQAIPPTERQASGVYGPLAFGAHAVGFQLFVEEDPSRSYPSGDSAMLRNRPIRVYVWYPADPTARRAMTTHLRWQEQLHRPMHCS